jgi:WD40 repeat protein
MAYTKASNFYGREDLIETASKMIISRTLLDTTNEENKQMLSAQIASSSVFHETSNVPTKRTSWIAKFPNSVYDRLVKGSPTLPGRSTENRNDPLNCHPASEGIPSSLHELTESNCEKKLPRNELFSGIDLALIGKSGSGKTALMAKLALSSIDDRGTIPTIIRFCGTSKFSLNGLKLVQTISIQLLASHGKLEELEAFLDSLPSQDYTAAVATFHRFIANYPVFLFIDSLDQLENRNEERSKLSFLRGIQPHEKSRIVVSSLPDEYEENGKPGKYFYQCERTLKTAGVPILKVGIMDQVEVTIETLLSRRNITLTIDQWMVTLQAVSHEPTILYINLAMEVISQWRSFDKEVILSPTVKGLIHQIFGDLELSYGKEFTSISFAMITFSREGVNDPELKDLLSLHEGVMTEVCQYSPLFFFPMHAWLRLKQVIKNLVTEKENHCIKWYHRQLWETASERYSEKEKECHEIMGKYFANRYDVNIKKEKDIMSQPLILNEVSVWMSKSLVNRRRVVEGYYHLIKGGLLQEAVEEVCSLEFVCCSALAGDLLNCGQYLGELVRLFGDDNDIPQQLDHYYRWMRKRATRVTTDPRRQTRMTAGKEPLISIVKKHISQLDGRERSELGYNLEPMTFGFVVDFDPLELELVGHTSFVHSVAWNHDDSKILSGSGDKTIKIWDGMTGELLNTLEGHFGSVNSVSWNQDSSKIVSGSDDGTIKIWDGITCELLTTLKECSSPIHSVCWNHDSSKIASTSNDKYAKIWDGVTCILLHTLSGHNECVHCVSWNHDGSKLLSGSFDNTIKIWNSKTGELLKTLEGHSSAVHFASWNHDSSRIGSGSDDNTIKIWDGVTGECFKTIESRYVHSVIWNREGNKLLSGSLDNTIKIWNAISGELEETVVQADNYSVTWNRDQSRIVSGSRTGTILVWKGWKGNETKEVSRITSISEWNPADSKRIASGSNDGAITVWDGKRGELLFHWFGHSERVVYVIWNHDGTRIASASRDKTIKIWDGVSYELRMTLEGHSEECNQVAWNHESSRILSVSQSEFLLWDGKTGEKLKTVENTVRSKCLISWNHDSCKLWIGYLKPGIITACNGETLLEERQFSLRDDHLNSISWSHDFTKMVSSSKSSDNTIQIWETESGNLLTTIVGHSHWVKSVFWNHDGSKIFSGSEDGIIRIWDGNTGQLLKTETIGGRINTMSLTKEEDRIAFCFELGSFLRCLSVTDL